MKIRILVFVFIVFGFMWGCSWGAKSRLLDGGGTLTINGSAVKGFNELKPKQQEAILGGTYKVMISSDEKGDIDKSYNVEGNCDKEDKEGNTKDGIKIDFKDTCKNYIKTNIEEAGKGIKLQILSSEGKVLLETKPTGFKLKDDKIHLNLQLEKTPELKSIVDSGAEESTNFEIKDSSGNVIISYDKNGNFKIGEGHLCCNAMNEKVTAGKVTNIKECKDYCPKGNGISITLQEDIQRMFENIGKQKANCSDEAPSGKVVYIELIDVSSENEGGVDWSNDTDLSFTLNEDASPFCTMEFFK